MKRSPYTQGLRAAPKRSQISEVWEPHVAKLRKFYIESQAMPLVLVAANLTKSHYMEIDIELGKACSREYTVLERPAKSMEWSIIPTRASRDKKFYGPQQYSVKSSCSNIGVYVQWNNAKQKLHINTKKLLTSICVLKLQSVVAYAPSLLSTIDSLSRLTAQTEWALSNIAFKIQDSRYGHHDRSVGQVGTAHTAPIMEFNLECDSKD
ncbi:hypothetical protein BB561_004113 [Smittium simulii]|uniref:Uncharacterized protein n=1 Tax=Smittium simulii TaxID=133385 RepID=A0A2T9YI64_9FUNG|nr:hypothetical protein BB561_004113 [Smittium simulii]